MRKILFCFILLFSTLYAKNQVEVYASSMSTQNEIVIANGSVNVVYNEYFLTANRARYNKNTGDLELFGNVKANYKKQIKVLGSYAKLNIKHKTRLFKPLYLAEKKMQVWISSKEGRSDHEDLEIVSGILSGCNPINPLWKMEFSSSSYNMQNKWINLFNARLYIYDILVFYTPYIGYSLDNRRRTGLLTPSIGFSSSEGIYYEQPLYIAEYDWWDIEFNPQIRTTRGAGLYSTLRFKDSKNSYGELNIGYFDENEEYKRVQNLKYGVHSGYSFKYKNPDFLKEWFGVRVDAQTGIVADLKSMSDVDYVNLQYKNTKSQETPTQVYSNVNLFYNTNQHYLGAYFKYYQNLTAQNNNNTLQKLPSIQYHYYLNTLFKDSFFYLLDIQSHNIYRNINTRVVQTDINVPLTLRTNIFDELLNLSYRANLYGQYSSFSEEETRNLGFTYRNGFFARNYHTFSLSSRVLKRYESLTHTMGIDLEYTKGDRELRDGFYEDNADFCSKSLNVNNARCEFYNIKNISEFLKIEFSQYFYKNAREFLYHRLTQKVSYERNQDQLGELENELNYKYSTYLSFYNNMFYNYQNDAFSKILNRVRFSSEDLTISLAHLYRENFLTPITPFSSYVTSSFLYKYNRHYSFKAKYDYDLQNRLKKNTEIGFLYKKRCWEFGLKYTENNRPIVTNSGNSSLYDRYIFLNITLKPFMQGKSDFYNISYKLDNNNEE